MTYFIQAIQNVASYNKKWAFAHFFLTKQERYIVDFTLPITQDNFTNTITFINFFTGPRHQITGITFYDGTEILQNNILSRVTTSLPFATL